MATIYKSTRGYVDVDFAFSQHPTSNNVTIKRNVNAVKQSVINLLLLREGDKPFHPEIKSPIYDFLFETTSVIEKVVLEGEVLKYLNRYEPRVEIQSVYISFDSPNAISCNVTGEIINLQQPIEVNILINRIR